MISGTQIFPTDKTSHPILEVFVFPSIKMSDILPRCFLEATYIIIYNWMCQVPGMNIDLARSISSFNG